MKATAALSIAALVAALLGTPATAFDPPLSHLDEPDDLGAALNAQLNSSLDGNGIDASTVLATGVCADGSVEVYEG